MHTVPAVGGSVVIQIGSKRSMSIGRRSAPAGAQAGSHAIHRVVCDAVKHPKPQRGDGSHRLRLRRPFRGWVDIGTQASTGCTRGYMPEPLPGLLARLSGAIWCRRIHRMNRTEHSLVLMGVRVSG